MTTRQDATDALMANVQRAEKIAVNLSEADLKRQVYESGWTVKDVFAHLASMSGSPAYFIGMAQMAASGSDGSKIGGGGFDIDAFNCHQVESRREKPLLDLLAELRRGHERGVDLINATADEVLAKKLPDPFLGGTSTALEMIRNSCSNHEAEHLDDVMAALRG